MCWDKIPREVNYWRDMYTYNRLLRTRLCPENSIHKIGIFLPFLCLKHTTSLVMSVGNISNDLSYHTNTICCCIWSSDQCTKISFVNSLWQSYKKQILSEMMWVNNWIYMYVPYFEFVWVDFSDILSPQMLS